MACRIQDKTIDDVLELLSQEGFGAVSEALVVLLNEAMKLERSAYLGVDAYERSPERRGHANGFKPKTVSTRVGNMTLAVPQTRDGGFYPSALEKGLRSERALRLALAEMYVQGVSTRKVAKITEELCGVDVTSMQVSRAAALLDETLDAWRTRRLEAMRYVYLDAQYQKVRHGGQVIDCAVLMGIGVDVHGKRQVLGVSVVLSEAEAHWRAFLSELKDRGLHGMELFISDAHEGLKAARTAVFPSVPWQRCQFHLQQNAQRYVPRQSLKRPVAAELRAVFNAPDRSEAERQLDMFVKRYQETAPALAQWAESAIPEGLTVFGFPDMHRRRLRTSNVVERLNKEIRRRSAVATLFPNEASCLRLVTAVVMEISEEWETGKVYLSMD